MFERQCIHDSDVKYLKAAWRHNQNVGDPCLGCPLRESWTFVPLKMATRSSARLAALSPPPLDLAPPNTAMSNSSKPTISSVEWTQAKLDEYNVKLLETSNLESFLPKQYTTDNEGQSILLLGVF